MAKDKNLFTRFKIFNHEFVVLVLSTGEILKGFYKMEGEIVHLLVREKQNGEVLEIIKDIPIDDIKGASFPSYNSAERKEYENIGSKRR